MARRSLYKKTLQQEQKNLTITQKDTQKISKMSYGTRSLVFEQIWHKIRHFNF